MITNYHYSAQLKSYLRQIALIFNGLQVKTGVGECGEEEFISVPCVIGSKDRVVAALMAGNTKNRVFSLPTMSLFLQNLTMAPERRKVQAMVDQRVTMKTGGIFPDDLTVVKRAMPVPFNMTVELTIYASNNDQMYQILEQILVLFNPDVQFQKSDAPFDWTKLTKIELIDIANEENYPAATDRRIINWTLTFEVPIYMSVPMGIKDDLVRKVTIQLAANSNMTPINEVDEDGNLTPFGTPIAIMEYDTRPFPTITEQDCTFTSVSVPENPQVNDTWWRPALNKAFRWNGASWVDFEQYIPPQRTNVTPFEPKPL